MSMLRLFSLLVLVLCNLSIVAALDESKEELAATAKKWATNTTPTKPVAPSAGSARIINGNDAGPFRYEYSVSLQDINFHYCGGSLIAPNIVLSAAHCAPSNVARTRANINQYNIFDPGENGQNDETIQVDSLRKHPDYDQATSLSNDFMLLKLASKSTNPFVKLNTDPNFPTTSDPELTVLGWGTVLQGVNQAPNVLQDVEVSYITNNQCKSAYGASSVSSDMLCCREAGQGACQGDSGGPLISAGGDGSDDVQVGVVSWGYDCALANYPGVYSRISAGWPWIRENVCQMTNNDAPAYFECGGSVPVPPGPAPTISPAPTLPKTEVLVRINTDNYPQELGWRIVTQSGNILIQKNPGSYNIPLQIISEIVELPADGTFILELVDQSSDGLCCDYGNGNVSVFLGTSAVSDMYLAYSDGKYMDDEDLTFTVSEAGIINVEDPAPAPTPAPVGAGGPSADFVVKIKTDLYPSESTWAIQSLRGETLYSGTPTIPDATNTFTVQLTIGETYTLLLTDNFGDGFCCDFGSGDAAIYFGSSLDDEHKVVAVDGTFSFSSSTDFVAEDLGGGGDGGNDDDTGGPGPICFPGAANLQVEGRGAVQMKDIKLGDKVLVDSNGKYEPVYSFAHRVEQGFEEFYQLVAHSTTLELTEEHMVFIEGGHSVPASMIKIGDKLELDTGEFDTVKAIHTVSRQGVYAPFTASGAVIVNGVKASTFISFQGSETMKVAGIDTGVTFQSLSRAFESPHRAWCQYLSTCTVEQYTSEGMSVWVDIPHKIARWAFDQSSPLLSLAAIPLACLVLLSYPIACAVPLLMLLAFASKRLALRVKSVR